MTLKTLTFSGTPGSDLTTPDGYIAYASPLIYDAAGDAVRAASGEFCQLVDSQACVGISEATANLRWVPGINSAEWGLCAIDGTQSGFSVLITNQYVDEVTGYITVGKIRKELLGGGYAEIDTVSDLAMITGLNKLFYRHTLPEGLVEVELNDTPIMSATYLDFTENLNPGFQAYTGADGLALVSLVTTVDTANATAINDLAEEVEQDETYTCSTTGLDAWAAVTLGTKELTFVNGVSITLPAWTNGYVEDLNLDSDYTLTITDINDVSATITVTYATPTGYTHNQMGAGMTIDTGPHSIGKDPAIINGTEVFPPVLGGGTMNNAGLFTGVPFDIYDGFWLRDLDLQMWQFGVTITNSEVIVDHTPNSFYFTDVANATADTEYESNTITIAGLGLESDVTIVGGLYSKNGGAYSSSATTAVNGNTFKLKLTSGPNPQDTVSSTLAVGTYSDTYNVRGPQASSGGGGSGGGYLRRSLKAIL